MDCVLKSYVHRAVAVLGDAYESAWLSHDEPDMNDRQRRFVRTVGLKAIKALTMIIRRTPGLPSDPPAIWSKVGNA